MKKLILAALLSIPLFCTAQNKLEEVKLSNGRTAVLYDNGLWVYKEDPKPEAQPRAVKTTPTPQQSGSSSSSSTASSPCGAPTKSGGSCRRLVKGGGRCWQHS